MVVLAAALVLAGEAQAKVYVAEPLLVQQPAYAGMVFYVYQPYDMPKDWYVTFDGYLVHKNSDGVWVYGTSNGPNLTPTNYIVGSVVPSMAGIAPWIQPAQISELRKVPHLGTMAVRQPAPPASQLTGGQVYSTWIPDWTYNPKFMAIGNWKGSVDRIGVLRNNPAVPVAWKGDKPKAVYAWTGKGWYQMDRRGSEAPVNILRREAYALNRMVKRNKLVWYQEDMPVLAQQTAAWGYYWMGEISLSR